MAAEDRYTHKSNRRDEPKKEPKKEPEGGKSDPGPSVGEGGRPAWGEMADRHTKERSDMSTRHEREHHDMMRRHHEEHKQMADRHVKEMDAMPQPAEEAGAGDAEQ